MNLLVDMDVFIDWLHNQVEAKAFFRNPPGQIYYARQTRKELLRGATSSSEERMILQRLARFRIVNLDNQIAQAYSELIQHYPYLQQHLSDTIIAATAKIKYLTLVTRNIRHFKPLISEIKIAKFPNDFDFLLLRKQPI